MRRRYPPPDIDAQMYVDEVTGRLDMAEEKAKNLNLHQRLLQVQRAVTSLTKDAVSGSDGNFPYVSSNMVLSTIRQAMDEAGLILVTDVVSYSVRTHTTQRGNEHYFTELMVEFTWINVDAPDEREVWRFPGQGIDPGEKGVGKASTYAEKYGILKFFHIPTDADDPDAGEPPAEGGGQAQGKAAPAAQGKAGSAPVCPDCGAPMVKRSGKKGEFWGCSTYGKSKCTGTLKVGEVQSPQPADDETGESPGPEAAADQGEDIPQNAGELRQWMTDKLGIASDMHQTTLDSVCGEPVNMAKMTIAQCADAYQKLLAAHEGPPEGAEQKPDPNPFEEPPEVPKYTAKKPPSLTELRKFWATVRGLEQADHAIIAKYVDVDLTAELEPADCWALWEGTWKGIEQNIEGWLTWVGLPEDGE